MLTLKKIIFVAKYQKNNWMRLFPKFLILYTKFQSKIRDRCIENYLFEKKEVKQKVREN